MINVHQNLPKIFFRSFEGSCWSQMHSSVLPSRHHHLECPSLNWFSINLITLQPYKENSDLITLQPYKENSEKSREYDDTNQYN